MKLHRKNDYLYENSVGLFVGIIVVLVVIGIIIQLVIAIVNAIVNAVNYIVMVISENWSIIVIVTTIIAIGIFIISGFKIIARGHKGLLTSFGGRTPNIKHEGLAWHIPLIQNIEMVDCRDRFMPSYHITFTLANLTSVNLICSIHYKISDPYNYFNNYNKNDFDSKIYSDVTGSLREFLSRAEITEKDLYKINTTEYNSKQLHEVNLQYTHRLGLEITRIVIESYQLEPEMKSFYNILHQADILSNERNMDYFNALKTVLVMNNRNYYEHSDAIIKSLAQIKKIQLMSGQ